jgi:monofunctional biosynthetic peptidoglycan transglycosylase
VTRLVQHAGRIAALVVISGLSLQLYFFGRIVLMNWIDPQSTSFQRSEMWRITAEKGQLAWSQQWVPRERIAPALQRAVIASEDAGFVDHSGVEWDALEKAWEKNQREEARVAKLNERAQQRAAKSNKPAPEKPVATPRIRGGSTITQQLAKNLFLSAERNFLRKGQEFAITFMLEAALSKGRILEIYLNNVEWGEGVFGAQAAARHYFRVDASQLGTGAAARLAVMLPAPKRFEKMPRSAYVSGRASTVAARLGAVELP